LFEELNGEIHMDEPAQPDRLKQLGRDLEAIDALIIDLTKRRMDIASLVIAEKIRKMPQGGRPKIVRADVEEDRLRAIREHALLRDVNPYFAQALLYLLIDESCKVQIQKFAESNEPDLETLNDDTRKRVLKENLLSLTADVAGDYDEEYSNGGIGTDTYVKFERQLIDQEIAKLPAHNLALDLGCGTGTIALRMAAQFKEVRGYDISQQMLYVAGTKRDERELGNVRFELADLEHLDTEIGTESASFAVMNLGTASDFFDLGAVLGKVSRALESGGRFFLSFYNADALVYKFGFLPWPVSLAAALDPYTHCLNVRVKEKTYQVYARLYSENQVRELMPPELQIETVCSHPLLSSILPDDFYKGSSSPLAVEEIDRTIATAASKALNSAGAYLIVTGRKI
jgi:ubiquinone/menaquinone biosynthesis C-methylase UbiE/chorismate mutase